MVNFQYKDRLFRFLFGREEYKENTLSLYNALNHTNYADASELKIYTIQDIIYIKMKNDVAFILDSYLSLWEQQSTYNPNMPLRGMLYSGRLYTKYIEENRINVYGSRLVKIPTPRYVVFYNGSREVEAVKKLRLSDAFYNEDKSGDFEWTAVMYNLNAKENVELLEKCKPLWEYMTLVNRIHDGIKEGLSKETAVDEAVASCIQEGILGNLLLSHRAEVCDMFMTEFDEVVYENGIREEGRAQGKLEGVELLRNTIIRLRAGESEQNLIAEGIDKKIVEMAKSLA